MRTLLTTGNLALGTAQLRFRSLIPAGIGNRFVIRQGGELLQPNVHTNHMIGRVWLEKGTLEILFLGDDWVKRQIEAGTFSLAHVDVGSNQILAAQTDDLRKFMQAHADDREALSSNFQFVRAK
jgi:hypothetical protein